MKNKNLRAAKNVKNDEFYTSYSDIEGEFSRVLDKNPNFFRNKSILCPCDDASNSAFVSFFLEKFSLLGISKLTCSHYAKNGNGGCSTYTLNEETSKISCKTMRLNGNGDFRSDEVKTMMAEASIVVTNPPFSLYREFIDTVVSLGCDYYVIGNKNCVNYNDIFHLLQQGKMMIGYTVPKTFTTPDGNTNRVNGLCRWYTNMDIGRTAEQLMLSAKYLPEKYPTYENYAAINVNKVSDIPSDYDGVMGVPITFLDKFNPEQFEILGRSGDTDWAFNQCKFFTPPSKERQEFLKKSYKNWRVQNSYLVRPDGTAECIYYRIFIRRKVPESDSVML